MGACSPERKKRINKAREIFDSWFDAEGKVGKNIYKVTGSDPKYWKQFYETEMKADFDYGDLPSMKDLKRLERKVGKFSRQMGKKPGKFAKWFYLPENVLSKNPVTKKFFEKMIRSGNFYRGEIEGVTSDLDRIVDLVNMSTVENTLMGKLGINRKNAQRELSKRTSDTNI